MRTSAPPWRSALIAITIGGVFGSIVPRLFAPMTASGIFLGAMVASIVWLAYESHRLNRRSAAIFQELLDLRDRAPIPPPPGATPDDAEVH